MIPVKTVETFAAGASPAALVIFKVPFVALSKFQFPAVKPTNAPLLDPVVLRPAGVVQAPDDVVQDTI